MVINPFPFTGLTNTDVEASRKAHGSNDLEQRTHDGLWVALWSTVKEPMFLLLLAAGIIYFLLGQRSEAWFMLGAIVLVSAISLYQDHRSRRALETLARFAEAKAQVIRNNTLVELIAEELVVGDLAVVSEGSLVPADGQVVHANDFAVNESILTGEAFSVPKAVSEDLTGRVYRGTQAVGGLAVVRITAVGRDTELGRIGTTLAGLATERSPLERQIRRFVQRMALVGALFFVLVWGLNYLASGDLLDSLLKGLTLAMSILPEEIPVAFTTFMALGAWRMMRLGVLVKQARTVETLGAATVICTDKTGTITENRMELAAVHLKGEPRPRTPEDLSDEPGLRFISTAMWASEPVPFDPMEKALHAAYARLAPVDERPAFHMVHEYPLSGRPPMMTHVFASDTGRRVIATKGAPEAILTCSAMSGEEQRSVLAQVDALAAQGYRVLAVGLSPHEGPTYPTTQQELGTTYLGLVAFHDPPKANMTDVFKSFHQAGIRTVIITGDNATTTKAVARAVGFRIAGEVMDGEAVRSLSEEQLGAVVRTSNCYTRMFPEAKLRVVKALKAQGHIVAMTGDGVNDGPALKAADIGVAMGQRGSELAKEAAALVLMDDDLGRMVDAIAAGRRIYSNLKKAIQYIISIHIPIILTVSLPLLLGWAYPDIFTPVHVIFLELLMGPTCSIAYENEPMEAGTMQRPPRRLDLTFLSWTELRTSLMQGLMITVGTMWSYQWAVQQGLGEDGVRTQVFITLVVANIALTLVNRSFRHSILTTLAYRNPLIRGILVATVLLLLALLHVPVLRDFFQLSMPTGGQQVVAVLLGLGSVVWYEGVKAWKRRTEDA